MSALIRVLLSGESAHLQPGERADLTLTVQNFSETVGRYLITVEGIPPHWVTLSRAELSLFPKDKDQVRVTVSPPVGTETRPGRYSVLVQVTSEDDPAERSTASFALEVGVQAALEVRLTPPSVRAARTASFAWQVSNQGNSDLTVLLEAVDPQGGCFFSFNPPQAVVPAGQSRSGQLTLQPTSPLPGKQPRVHSFTVAARPAEAPRLAQQVNGLWEELPRRTFLLPILIGVGVLLLAAAAVLFVLFLLPRLQAGGGPVAQGPTAEATKAPPPATVPTQVPIVPTVPTVFPTVGPTIAPTVAPSAVPSPEPTPDLKAEIEARLWDYTWVRAAAETQLDPELLKQVCVDPYLTTKSERINANKAAGVHYETPSVDFTITSFAQEAPDRVKVGVRKTETKLFFPKGATQPDDEICSGTIYSFRNCTYDVLYTMLLRDGVWYVSEAVDTGDCVRQCQH